MHDLVNTPPRSSTRANARVALVTCAELPDLEPDDQLIYEPLKALGIQPIPAVWNDKAVDWSSFDLVVLRSSWDYATWRPEFVEWAHSVERLRNPAAVVEWNTDKRYLAELAAGGAPVVPTTFVSPNDSWHPPAYDEYVIKPAVSVGSLDTGRYDASYRAQAVSHVARLQAAGRITMIQPYLPAVDDHGETALLYFADPATGALAYSHAIRKGPMLQGPDVGVVGLYKQEEITRREPTPAELAVGDAVLAAAPQGLLYARVDLIPDPEGNPLLIELELTEPSLFFEYSDGAAERFAAAIKAAIAAVPG
ncbi:MAG TPA: hypothetical protein VFC19_39895 [Candidatus Limnocylindrales bacterium]|nr:hypothetical protein [Candidatus Limnocylindrales bacterium]